MLGLAGHRRRTAGHRVAAGVLVWLGLGGLWAGRNALNRKFYSEKRQCFAISEEPTLFLSLTEDKDYREALMQAEFLDGKLEVVRVGPSSRHRLRSAYSVAAIIPWRQRFILRCA